jgi:hypothetical protein
MLPVGVEPTLSASTQKEINNSCFKYDYKHGALTTMLREQDYFNFNCSISNYMLWLNLRISIG